MLLDLQLPDLAGDEVLQQLRDEQWLAPMLVALLDHLDGPDSFAHFFESAVAEASVDVPSDHVLAEMFGDRVPGGRIKGVDWIRLGHLMRDQLGWEHYPAFPTTN